MFMRRRSRIAGNMSSIGIKKSVKENFGGARRNRTADNGFADHCLTTWRPRHRTGKLSVLSNQFSVRKKCAEASVLYLQALGDELSFFIPNGFQFSVAVRKNNV